MFAGSEFPVGRKYGRESAGLCFSIEAFKQFDGGAQLQDPNDALQTGDLGTTAGRCIVFAEIGCFALQWPLPYME